MLSIVSKWTMKVKPVDNAHGVENSNLFAAVLKAIQPLPIQYPETILDDKFPVGPPSL